MTDLRQNRAASVIWQDIRATGMAAPTWAFSDRAREAGAQGMFYASRSRPDLTHLVLFDLSVITKAGAPQPLPDGQPL